MKKLVPVILGVVVFAIMVQWAVIKYTPNIIFKIASRRARVSNRWVNANKTDAAMRQVVLPNPDFIYSALFYDVNGKDLILTGVLPDSTYASVSFYDDRCQPWYVYNNLSADRTGNFNFQISKNRIRSAHQLQAKTNKDVIICRFLVKSDSLFDKMRSYQHQLDCKLSSFN